MLKNKSSDISDPTLEAELRPQRVWKYSPRLALENNHAPDATQVAQLQAVRSDAKRLATTILANAPACADTQAGLRLLREAVMTVNAAIALKGAV